MLNVHAFNTSAFFLLKTHPHCKYVSFFSYNFFFFFFSCLGKLAKRNMNIIILTFPLLHDINECTHLAAEAEWGWIFFYFLTQNGKGSRYRNVLTSLFFLFRSVSFKWNSIQAACYMRYKMFPYVTSTMPYLFVTCFSLPIDSRKCVWNKINTVGFRWFLYIC